MYPVADYRGIRKDNWYTDEEWIRIVMGEVVKIGKYFEKEIVGLAQKYE